MVKPNGWREYEISLIGLVCKIMGCFPYRPTQRVVNPDILPKQRAASNSSSGCPPFCSLPNDTPRLILPQVHNTKPFDLAGTYLRQPVGFHSGYYGNMKQKDAAEDAHNERKIPHEHKGAKVACPRLKHAFFRCNIFRDVCRPPEVNPPLREKMQRRQGTAAYTTKSVLVQACYSETPMVTASNFVVRPYPLHLHPFLKQSVRVRNMCTLVTAKGWRSDGWGY